MTVATLNKYKAYLYDEHGKPVAVQLDLRNKTMRKFYETMMEDFEDTLEARARDDEETVSWEAVKEDLNAKWNEA